MGIRKASLSRDELIFFTDLTVAYLDGASRTANVPSETEARTLLKSWNINNQIASYTLCNFIRRKGDPDWRSIRPVYTEEYNMDDPARLIPLTNGANVRFEILVDTDNDPQYEMGEILTDEADLSCSADILDSDIFTEIGTELVNQGPGKFRYVVDFTVRYEHNNYFDYSDVDIDYSYQTILKEELATANERILKEEKYYQRLEEEKYYQEYAEDEEYYDMLYELYEDEMTQ